MERHFLINTRDLYFFIVLMARIEPILKDKDFIYFGNF